MMPDREKVINALENALAENKYRRYEPIKFSFEVVEIIIDLLKEQEAVKPKKVKGYNPPMYTIYEYECEKCKSPMLNKQPFCMGCGKTVKWE